MYDVLIKNGKLVTPDRIYEADIAIKNEKYAAFLLPGTETEAEEVIDAKGCYVLDVYKRQLRMQSNGSMNWVLSLIKKKTEEW